MRRRAAASNGIDEEQQIDMLLQEDAQPIEGVGADRLKAEIAMMTKVLPVTTKNAKGQVTFTLARKHQSSRTANQN